MQMIDTPSETVTHSTPHNAMPIGLNDSLFNVNIPVTTQTSENNAANAPPTLDFLASHIETAHATGLWTWEHVQDDRWKNMFYTHLVRHSLTATPLTQLEANEYESQLHTSLPQAGFFPAPHIMYKNLALIRQRARTHNPLPLHLQETSTLCVPDEHYATAACDYHAGTFLGFYMGWVVSPAVPASPHHTFRIHTP